MPLSLKCQIDKLEHKGQITKEEHQALLKKLDGHDRQIRADVIDEMFMLVMNAYHEDNLDECSLHQIERQLKAQNEIR